MSNRPTPDWDPTSPEIQRDQRAAYDEMRRRCPVAYSEFLGWSLFRHEDVTRVLLEYETFSSAVSQHLSVPSGMDPPEHTAYRRIIEPYFAPNRMQAFEPECRGLAQNVVQDLSGRGQTEFMAAAAQGMRVRQHQAAAAGADGLQGFLGVGGGHRLIAEFLDQGRQCFELRRIAIEDPGREGTLRCSDFDGFGVGLSHTREIAQAGFQPLRRRAQLGIAARGDCRVPVTPARSWP